jgi:hypothetical protein
MIPPKIGKETKLDLLQCEYASETERVIHPVALVARDIYTRHWLCDKKQHKHPKYQSSIED